MPTLQEYMSKTYSMLIEPDEEVGYLVTYPDLPGIIANSSDIKDAVSAAEELREAWIDEHLQRGWPVPLPGELSSCNGTLTVRIPVSLRRRLKLKAKQKKTTLNQYAPYLLSRGGN